MRPPSFPSSAIPPHLWQQKAACVIDLVVSSTRAHLQLDIAAHSLNLSGPTASHRNYLADIGQSRRELTSTAYQRGREESLQFVAPREGLRHGVAREQLAQGCSVQQAAHFVGYRHATNFATAFRERYGIAPSELN